MYADGSLVAGEARGTADLTHPGEFWLKELAALQVVALAPGVTAILVALPLADEEDPASRFQLFVPEGRQLLRVLDITPGFGRVQRLRFPGDGTLRYVETQSEACARYGLKPGTTPLHEVTYELSGTVMRETARKPTVRTVDCSPDALVACPSVYMLGAGSATFAGEILRNLRAPEEYALQGLALAAPGALALRVRLAEEKPETTYLDEVFVLAGEQRIHPRACSEANPPAFCAPDGTPYLLRRGAALELTFALSDPFVRPVLFARGYYLPDAR